MTDDASDERWLPVVGHEGRYEVSDCGRVRSVARYIQRSNGVPQTLFGRLLSPTLSKQTGYYKIGLVDDAGETRGHYVHRLVLSAFVYPCPEDQEGCHNDGCRTNNTLSNLRWATSSANNYDRVRHGMHPMTWRLNCPRDHALAEPNLVASMARKGRRSCLACARARARIQNRTNRGQSVEELKPLSDAYYAEIMRSAAPVM